MALSDSKRKRRMTGFNFRQRVNAMSEKIKDVEIERQALIKTFQSKCKHPAHALREVPVGGLRHDSKPARLCVECGVTEEGWTYEKLKADVDIPIVSDSYFVKYRLLTE